MTLKYVDLWGEIHYKDLEAISLIKQYAPLEGYYVAFSGGKDSIVILDLVKRAGVKHDIHFAMTTIDPPEVLKFIKENYPEVIWEKPKKNKNMYSIIIKRGFPPTRHKRYCCGDLKEIGGRNRVVVLGIRKEESNSRRERREWEQSTVDKTKWFVNPILSWTTEDVWEYIKKYKLPYCELYDQGYERIGCIMCPLQREKGMIKDAIRFPKHYKTFMDTFDKMLTRQDREDREEYGWKSAEDVMYWWIYGKNRDISTKQSTISLPEYYNIVDKQ